MRDMTERRHAEEALRESQQKLLELPARRNAESRPVCCTTRQCPQQRDVSASLVIESCAARSAKARQAAALLTGRTATSPNT